MASKRRGGRASAKRKASARAAAKRAADRRAEKKIDRRGSYLASGGSRGDRIKSRTATGGTSTGRESGIAAANTYDRNKKERSLEQSLGSIDRRVEKALEDGNTDLAKDLRSRQNKFAKLLGLERVRKTPGGTIQGNVRMRDGTRPMTTAGFDVFQDTVDRDFLDPTRRLQNLYPEQAREMYPIESRLQMGLPTVQAIKALFDIKDKPIPYSDPRMPGERYPLDVDFGAGEGEPFFGGRSNDPNFDSYPYIAPTEPVKITDLDFDPNPQFSESDLVLPNMAPFIDKETRNEVFAPDVDNLPANNFAELDKEFQKESKEYFEKKANEPTVADKYPYEVASNEPIKSYFNLFGQNDAEGTPTGGEQQLIDALNASGATNVQDELTSAALQAPGYNLNPNIIDQLFEQGFLTPGTNYFGSTDAGTPVTNPIVDEALASYYDSLK